MLRVRSGRGEIIPLPADAAAIEICSSDGKLCNLLVCGQDGAITLLSPEDDAFRRYARATKQEVARSIKLEENYKIDQDLSVRVP